MTSSDSTSESYSNSLRTGSIPTANSFCPSWERNIIGVHWCATRGGLVGMMRWCVLVCRWQHQVADPHFLPFPYLLPFTGGGGCSVSPTPAAWTGVSRGGGDQRFFWFWAFINSLFHSERFKYTQCRTHPFYRSTQMGGKWGKWGKLGGGTADVFLCMAHACLSFGG